MPGLFAEDPSWSFSWPTSNSLNCRFFGFFYRFGAFIVDSSDGLIQILSSRMAAEKVPLLGPSPSAVRAVLRGDALSRGHALTPSPNALSHGGSINVRAVPNGRRFASLRSTFERLCWTLDLAWLGPLPCCALCCALCCVPL